MSQQSNSELVLSLYAAFNRGDVQYILDRVTDDTEWVTEGPASVPYCGHFRGKPDVQRFFEIIGSTQKEARVTTDKVITEGDSVATVGRYAGTIVATGKRFDVLLGHVFTIREGKVTQFLDFFDTAALEAAYSAAVATA